MIGSTVSICCLVISGAAYICPFLLELARLMKAAPGGSDRAVTTSLTRRDKLVSETQTQIQLKQDPKSNVQLRPTAVTVTFRQAAGRPRIASGRACGPALSVTGWAGPAFVRWSVREERGQIYCAPEVR